MWIKNKNGQVENLLNFTHLIKGISLQNPYEIFLIIIILIS